MTSRAEKVRLKIIQLSCAVGVKTTFQCPAGLWVMPLVGSVVLWWSCPGVITLAAAPQQQRAPQGSAALLPTKCWVPLCFTRLVPTPGQSLGSKPDDPACPGEGTLLSLCCRPCCRGNLPRARAPSLDNSSHGFVWETHFRSCRSGLPPGGGTHSRVSDRRWVHLGKVDALSRGTAGRDPSKPKMLLYWELCTQNSSFSEGWARSSHRLERRCFGA